MRLMLSNNRKSEICRCQIINMPEKMTMYTHLHRYYFLEQNLIDYHNITLIYESDILDAIYFKEALQTLGLVGLNSGQCVGYKLPLFLNGKADSSNYEIIDVEIYWDTQFQIFNQIKDLPEGTRINKVAVVPQFNYDTKNKLE